VQPGLVPQHRHEPRRDTGKILGEAARTLDFGQPVAVMLGVLTVVWTDVF
jgi:hypothetical protein